jgi:hypothetical protein
MSKEPALKRNLQRPWLSWMAVTLFILWLFYGLSAYYVVQKPLSLPLVTSLVERSDTWLRVSFSGAALGRGLLDLGIALWLIVIALGIGMIVLNRLSLFPHSDLDIALLGTGLGFGFLGLAVLFLGLAGLLQPSLFYALAIVLTLLTAPKLLPFIRSVRFPTPSRLVGAYLILTIGLALFIALLPPTSWDALFYHLKGPKLYLEAGRIRPGIDIPHLNFPSLFEMLFMSAMAMRGDVAAKLLHFAFSFMLAGLVYATARDHLQVKNNWISVIFLYATPMVLLLAGWAYNDLALAFYQLAALYALLHWQRNRHGQWLVLGGLLCGFALSLKYTSFVAPLIFTGILVWEFRQRLIQVGRPLLLLIIPTLLIASPWYLKNLFFTGNPVYPFVLNGRFWDDFRAMAFAGNGTGLGFDPIALLRLPHDLTLGLQDASQDGPTGPFYLIFLPLLLFYALSPQRKHTLLAFRYLLLFALAQYLFWMVGVIYSAGLWQSRVVFGPVGAVFTANGRVWPGSGRI